MTAEATSGASAEAIRTEPAARSPIEFVVPGEITTRTGGYGYDRRIVAALRASGRSVRIHELAGPWPWPDAATRTAAGRLLASFPDGRHVVVDGLAYGALPDIAHAAAGRLALVALVHHPLALESGLSAEDAARLRDAERRALGAATRVVTTSPATSAALAAYGVAAARIATVPPGTDAAPAACGSSAGTGNLLCVATLTRRKGHDVLLDALAGLPAHGWRLVCVGSATRDAATAAALGERVRRLGLEGRITFAGELDDAALGARWAEADLFVLASRHEGYGMVLDEALARALPIVASGTGAVADTVPADAGLVVAPDDADALRAALARWFAEPALRDALRAGARRARGTLRTWQAAGAAFARAVDAATLAREPSGRETISR